MLNEDRIHLHVYGIRNCDSCRAALKWLQMRNVPHTFHDFRAEGIAPELLKNWLLSPHAAGLVNRRSTTWRQLSAEEKQAAEDNPLELLPAHPTLIKRPVITNGANILDIGFSPSHLEDYI
ncbi:MAG: Spx/MgsR family RNA polymerase-binding regulatory protein [Xanthomonadales bacterium]|nr:Spx/MgsR family RNA polymerase-binding regulatory protein [Gammaproteobacteria bacterium]MBT8053852.1 Spx/MgsR family RNA polymerase-binding regulatory protein [Gammaproteobacteria bacterium]NND58335.1 Spx/MgsR family RNA polymerase-binding regulatory protein [Xanthomonadales bacterium]NNK51837.1 Spx/MgsR family RNA polymerase-binding regulatory protein [Xanthomonadales bacterium]